MCTIQRNILDARRWLSLFLVCCIVLCGIGGIHQRAQALVGIDDALVAIVIAGLAAVGITFVSTGAYNSLEEYVGSLMDEYAGSRGLTPAGLFTGVQSGANSLGQILINSRFVQLIDTFGQWLVSKYTMTSGNNYTLVEQGTWIGSYKAYSLPMYFLRHNKFANDPNYYLEIIISSSPVYLIAYYDTSSKTSVGFVAYSTEQATLQMYNYYPSTNTFTEYGNSYTLTKRGNYYYAVNNGSYTIYNGNNNGYDLQGVTTIYDQNWPSILSGLDSNREIDVNNLGVGIDTGNIVLPLDDPNYNQDDGAIIDVSAPWGMTYPDIVNKWIPKEWSPGLTGNPSLTYDSQQAVDEQVTTGPETVQVSSDAGEYAVPGLQSVFPFCIPFDIYNLLSALAADPVAPSFTWRFYVPRVCDETFTVDLSPFDTVAQVVRTVELLAFIVGLAMVTRERFLRG